MFNPVTIIEHKRDGLCLSKEEIQFFISEYARDAIPNYQMSALAMAIYLKGMTPEEIADLTLAMIETGERLKSVSDSPRVDKHSTGGLGDKVSLILAPLLAVLDVHVPMISGRGLGITGGTLDKLEAIPGYRTNLSEAEIENQLAKVGCVITGASERIVPADKRLYALRDVTATVPSIPLITASILSKKTAESLTALVLDVKFGSGAFMQTEADARALAASLVNTGKYLGVKTSALLTDMTQPLGKMVGNANEVFESIETLQGGDPADVRELTIALCAKLMVDVGSCTSIEQARTALTEKLDSGAAYERFEAMVNAQGGKLSDVPKLAPAFEFHAPRGGIMQSMNGQRLGYAVIALGGGRKVVGQAIDFVVGLEMLCRVGDSITSGQPLVKVFHSATSDRAAAEEWIAKAFQIGDEKPTAVPLYQELS